MLHVSVNTAATRFIARGGDPKGNDNVNSVVSSWPGWSRVAGRSKHAECSVYAGPLSIPSAMALSSTALDVTLEDGAQERASDLLRRFELARSVLEGRDAVALVRPPPRTLFPHQTSAVAALWHMDGVGLLADDMGLGKSATALALGHLMEVDRILILCPASVKFNWVNEIGLTLGDGWPSVVINGTAKQRAAQFDDTRTVFAQHSRLAIIINYDLLQHLGADQLALLENFAAGQLVVMDESHYLKNHKSERSKIVASRFCSSEGGARYRLALTGTPIRNTVEDLYHQIELLRPGTFQSFHWFLNRFTVQSMLRIPYQRGGRTLHRQVRKVRRSKNTDELNQIVNTIQIRRLKSEVMNLPPKVRTYPELELDTHTAKIYAAMRDYALLLLEEHDDDVSVLSPTCRSAVEAAARCEQIAQGCVGGIPESLMHRVSGVLAQHAESVPGKDGWLVFPRSTKLAWTVEQLDSIQAQGNQCVVFCRFNAPLLWLASKRLGVAITGTMSAAQRQLVFDDFQSGDVPELYIQIRIAEGFNLHAAQDEIFLGRDWAPSVNFQAEDRCHRIGQTGTVNIQIPFVRGTIEVRLHWSLGEKATDAENTLCFRSIADLKAALS